jgi:hypothetical protein
MRMGVQAFGATCGQFEMKEIFERLRDKEFAIHVCTQHPRAEKAKG